MNKLIEYIRKLVLSRFYGKIELSFEAGKITNVKEVKSLNPAQFKEVKG